MTGSCVAFGICFILAGIAFFLGLVHPHLQGWKKMTPAEQAAIDIEGLCRNIGFMIALSGVIFVAAGVNTFFHENLFIWCMIAWFVLCGVDVWQIEKKRR